MARTVPMTIFNKHASDNRGLAANAIHQSAHLPSGTVIQARFQPGSSLATIARVYRCARVPLTSCGVNNHRASDSARRNVPVPDSRLLLRMRFRTIVERKIRPSSHLTHATRRPFQQNWPWPGDVRRRFHFWAIRLAASVCLAMAYTRAAIKSNRCVSSVIRRPRHFHQFGWHFFQVTPDLSMA